MNIAHIKAVAFDLGGVVIELHYDRTKAILKQLSDSPLLEDSRLLVNAELLKGYEVGAISDGEFRSSMAKQLGFSVSDEQFDLLWNALLGDISAQRVAKMLSLKDRFKTFILSNTNAIHERCFNQQLAKVHGISAVDGLVHKALLSHRIGRRKPNRDIYDFLIRTARCEPHELLFIDDREDNIMGAREAGLSVYHNEHLDDWITLFDA